MMIAPGLQSVAIIGNDLAAWMSAALFAVQTYSAKPVIRVFTGVNCLENTEVQAPLPEFQSFLSAVGVSPQEVVSECHGVPRLGAKYILPNKEFVHVWGEYGAPIGILEFNQLLVRYMREGGSVDLNQLSIAASAVMEKKFELPATDSDSIRSTYEASLAFATTDFLALLQKIALRNGVLVDSAKVSDIKFVGDQISVLTKPDAVFLCDYLINSSDCYGDLTQNTAGWCGAYSASLRKEKPATGDELLSSVVRFSEENQWTVTQSIRGTQSQTTYQVKKESDPQDGNISSFGYSDTPRQAKWINIGSQAVNLPSPLVSEADLIWMSLKALLKYFPSPNDQPAVVKEYNRLVASALANIKDLTLALLKITTDPTVSGAALEHYGELSEDLLSKVELFRYRGKIPFYELEMIKTNWQVWLFLGLGLIPENVEPLAMEIDPERLKKIIDSVKRAVIKDLAKWAKYPQAQ